MPPKITVGKEGHLTSKNLRSGKGHRAIYIHWPGLRVAVLSPQPFTKSAEEPQNNQHLNFPAAHGKYVPYHPRIGSHALAVWSLIRIRPCYVFLPETL